MTATKIAEATPMTLRKTIILAAIPHPFHFTFHAHFQIDTEANTKYTNHKIDILILIVGQPRFSRAVNIREKMRFPPTPISQ